MSKFGAELIESLSEAALHAEGSPNGVRVRVVTVPYVKAISENLHVTQDEFPASYGVSLETLRG